jgi:hypothetical protein
LSKACCSSISNAGIPNITGAAKMVKISPKAAKPIARSTGNATYLNLVFYFETMIKAAINNKKLPMASKG